MGDRCWVMVETSRVRIALGGLLQNRGHMDRRSDVDAIARLHLRSGREAAARPLAEHDRDRHPAAGPRNVRTAPRTQFGALLQSVERPQIDVHFTVVDGCGEWSSFVGGGTGAGF